MEKNWQWRRLPHLDFEYDLSVTELLEIFHDDQWQPVLKKLCQLAVHPNTPAVLLKQLAQEYLDDDYHSLQRCLWMRAQLQEESTEGLRPEVLAAILHQQLRFARLAGQIKRDLAAGIFGLHQLDISEAEEITNVIEIYAILTNCSIPDPGEKVLIWLIGIAQDAMEFARNELYFFYLVPESTANCFYRWARKMHSQTENPLH
jgi:hypothetical protein